MKKTILIILFAVLISLTFGNYIFSLYNGEVTPVTVDLDEMVYVIQQGVYSSEENAHKNSKDLDFYIVKKDNDYYRVYVGLTHDKNISEKIKEIYTDGGKDIYVYEKKINNDAFIEVLKQYDNILNERNKAEEILSIQKQVLSKYRELVLEDEEFAD